MLTVLFGCQRETTIPHGTFRLSVENVASNATSRICLLTIRVAGRARMSVNREDIRDVLVLGREHDGVFKGYVGLTAWRIPTNEGRHSFAFIRTTVRPTITNDVIAASRTGGEAWVARLDTKLADLLEISAADGDYGLGKPVTIAEINGSPVTLVVSQGN